MAHIVVCGYMVRHPVAGNLLAFFHYVLGLSQLGYQVVYLEESGWSQSCYNPHLQAYSEDPTVGIQAVQALIRRFGLQVSLGYIDRNSGMAYGLDWHRIKQALKTADLLLNIGGVCWLPEFRLCRCLALIDMDPLFTQAGEFASEGREEYHIRFSYGVNLGQPSCSIPTHGENWIPTVPPVVPEIWSSNRVSLADRETHPFTTIANWKAYGGVIYQGEYYGQKREEFLKIIHLPSRTSQRLELSLSGANSAELEHLKSAGWFVRDSQDSYDFETYQSYIMRSKGEFSVAKNAYVKTRSGWFSDRSVCYLAAGRPVILQDTGFSDWLPTGRGVFAFSSLKEAVEQIEQVSAAYPEHCCAAREVAEQIFSYKVVLPRLLEHHFDPPTSSYSLS
ncbi:hypothetical protein H6F89_30955 [Cyanobacteria bacterium FACHB-63]|nr:hypothetical protein [Cyanobacteria bacterium FACHB-63]